MQKPFSLYLDLVRFLAAFFVVIAHFIQHEIVNRSTAFFLPEVGREAVIVFFVLSGYVIAYTTAQKNQPIEAYFIARCARIYSVAFPLLLAAFLVGFIIISLNLTVHSALYQVAKPHIYIPFHVLFLGELWNLSETPPWLGQYWSLGYEVWYYVFFATLFYFNGYKRVLLAGTVFLILGHKLWLLLPVWFSGVYLYHWQKQRTISTRVARVGWCMTLVFLAIYKLLDLDIFLRALGNEIWLFSYLNLGSADRYLADYMICVLVCLNFAFAEKAEFTSLVSFESLIRNFASYTFTLYLVHGLIMGVWTILYVHNSSSFADIFLLSLLIALTTYAVGLSTEHRKMWFQRIFERLWRGVSGRIRVASSY